MYNLVKLYECVNGTKSVNLAIKRHINRFLESFMFQLTKNEYYNILRFQSETLELVQGVAMLATVLRTPVAEEINIKIMDTFVALCANIYSNLLVSKNINNLVLEDHELIMKNQKRIEVIEDTLAKFEEKDK